MAHEEKRHPVWRPFWSVPFFEEDFFEVDLPKSGVSVSENDNNVYVEAHLPGLQPENIEVSYENGTLLIKGAKKEEKKDEKKKYYRKASSSFFYRVNVPVQINETKEPDASYKDGILKITFAKTRTTPPKKISVKKGS